MWAFLVQEILFFGGLFAAYLVYRMSYPEAFIQGSHYLDITLGGVNTAILICSSLTMALAVFYGQQSKRQQLILFLFLTIVLGAAFLGIKAVEYTHKYHEHLIPGPMFHPAEAHPPQMQIFFALYFAMTGMHALHMVIGIGILFFLIYQARQGRYSREYNSPIEIFGLYWHFVDIVWIFLFPLLYLIGRH
ncbi:cytochrome c oxidase subunit 3 family protein [candidate division KSB1 bacterium]|nr:cytochrome c oxidase subunit 3 family protein [candidate division KSB1 bacterium]